MEMDCGVTIAFFFLNVIVHIWYVLRKILGIKTVIDNNAVFKMLSVGSSTVGPS